MLHFGSLYRKTHINKTNKACEPVQETLMDHTIGIKSYGFKRPEGPEVPQTAIATPINP